MGELADRASAVAGRAAGNTVGPAVTALMTAVGVATGQLDLAIWAVPAGATAGSLTEEGVALVRRAWQDKADRMDRFARSAAEDAGTSVEELIEAALADPRLRALLNRTATAAATALDDEKVDILARAFARAVDDPAQVDELLVLTNIVRDLDVPHIRVMSLLLTAKDGALKGFRDSLTTEELADRQFRIGIAASFLVFELSRMGFLQEVGERRWTLTDVGEAVARALDDLGQARGYIVSRRA
jgi:hypothetical protein